MKRLILSTKPINDTPGELKLVKIPFGHPEEGKWLVDNIQVVGAVVYGQWGIREIDDEQCNVFHVPTGWTVSRVLWSEFDARELVGKLLHLPSIEMPRDKDSPHLESAKAIVKAFTHGEEETTD